MFLPCLKSSNCFSTTLRINSSGLQVATWPVPWPLSYHVLPASLQFYQHWLSFCFTSMLSSHSPSIFLFSQVLENLYLLFLSWNDLALNLLLLFFFPRRAPCAYREGDPPLLIGHHNTLFHFLYSFHYLKTYSFICLLPNPLLKYIPLSHIN